MSHNQYLTWNYLNNSQKIHYKEFGEGSDHILLIHGYGSHTCTWNDLFEPLVKAGYKVWALDLLGFGYSDKPLDCDYGLELYLQQILAFMNAMHIPKANLIAHSMGGTVALGLAINYPEKVKSLTLISPLAYPIKLPLGFRFAKRFPSLIKPFCGLTFIRLLRKNLVINTKVACTPNKVSEATEPFLMPNGPDAAFKILGHFNNQLLIEISTEYNRIKLATLILWGKEDPLIPSHHTRFFRRNIPHAEIIVVDQCGHIPHEEYPKEVESYILKFLKNRN